VGFVQRSKVLKWFPACAGMTLGWGVDCGVRCGICATIKGLKMVPGLRRDDDGKLRANGSIYWFAIT